MTSRAAAALKPQTIPFQPSPAKTAHRQTIPAPAASKGYVYVWKDELDASAPLWKRLVFWCIYRPFNQFCRFTLKIPSFNGEQCGCGAKRLIWTEHQDIVDFEWQAIQECEAHNSHWGYHMLPYNTPTSEETILDCPNHNYPLADVKLQTKLHRAANPTVAIPSLDAARLEKKISSSDGLVEQFRSRSPV